MNMRIMPVNSIQGLPTQEQRLPGSSQPRGSYGFGPAFVREAASAQPEAALYGSNGLLAGKAGRAGATGVTNTKGTTDTTGITDRTDETGQAADARMGSALERRDAEVRSTENSKGEALGGSNFIYQTGQDGELYAIGTRPHLVEKDGGLADGSSTGAAGTINTAGATGATSGTGLPEEADTPENRELLQKLQERDAHVKAHESAHVMAAGGQAGAVTYSYQRGPDGRSYAVGGSVNISVSSSGDADESARQAGRAQRAATVNGEMSAADAQTARRAGEISARARAMALEKYSAMQE
ncbi:hypothetical protein LJC48_05045 [Desulfovibrio sp. OttesenSCG-928-C06]|nr:hypothetical protein [Desulfovibrio sp. OttesenSCG-928-C06]